MSPAPCNVLFTVSVTTLQRKCEEYQAAIQDAKASMVVIGCGDAKNLSNYRKETGFKGPLYSGAAFLFSRTLFSVLDHKRDLYKRLQLYVSKGMSEFKSDKTSPYATTGPIFPELSCLIHRHFFWHGVVDEGSVVFLWHGRYLSARWRFRIFIEWGDCLSGALLIFSFF